MKGRNNGMKDSRTIEIFLRKHYKTLIKVALIIIIIASAAIIRTVNESRNSIEIVRTDSETVSDDGSVSQGVPNGQTTVQDRSSTSDVEDSGQETIFVDISGEVNSPGVYEVASDSRLFEVIEKAGGLTEEANLDGINQAATVSDGEKIIIPEIGVEAQRTYSGSSVIEAGNELIDINNADKDRLTELPGIGEVLADRIIEYRNTKRFESPEDIKNVSGIGDSVYEKIKDRIKV